MSGTKAVAQSRIRRRSREEADLLVLEYECSGITREAFCNQHGFSATMLDNYPKRRRGDESAECGAIDPRPFSVVPASVDLVDGSPVAAGFTDKARLFVQVASGRRIGVADGFDQATLLR